MPIILSGGGNPEEVVPVDKYFTSIIDLHKIVLYIPIAMEPEVFSYDQCYQWFKCTYGHYGVTNIELCTNLNEVALNSQVGAVFIGGGNAFKLLNGIQHSNFSIQIRAYLNQGGVLYGGSAGAIVCGKTIAPAIYTDENRVGITDYSGLDILDGFDVFCHYNAAQHNSFINKLNRNLYILYEESGLIVDDSTVVPIGKPFIVKTVW